MENFPWTRLPGIDAPDGHKPFAPPTSDEPTEVRRQLGDGSYGGWYALPDADVLRVWESGVDETRAALESITA
jgi:creatinine amidohydrolase